MSKLDLHLGASDVGIQNSQGGLWFMLGGGHHHRHIGGPGSDKTAGERGHVRVRRGLYLDQPAHVSAKVPGLRQRTVDAGRSYLQDVGCLAQGVGGVQANTDDAGRIGHLVQRERIDHAGLITGIKPGKVTVKPDPDEPALAGGGHCQVLDCQTKLPKGTGSVNGALQVTQDVVNSFLNTQLTPPLPFLG